MDVQVGVSAIYVEDGIIGMHLQEINGERGCLMSIGAAEAKAIMMVLGGVQTPRPMTHDLLKTVIGMYGGTVEKVTITELVDDIFYAVITAQDGDVALAVDARPSDSIALALRANCPIYVNEALLDGPNDDGGGGEKKLADPNSMTDADWQKLIGNLDKKISDS